MNVVCNFNLVRTRTLPSGAFFSRHYSNTKHSQHQIDDRVGTVAPHRHHLVICNSLSDEWPSKIEHMSPVVTALARGSIRLPGRAMVTMSDFAPLQSKANNYDRIDVAILPLGLVAHQLDSEGVDKLLRWLSHEQLPTSWSPHIGELPRPDFNHRWLELTHNRHIFVCTHGTRDQRCGIFGTRLLDQLRELISKRGLSRHIGAWSTSHIGGHKYAANAIVYPRGDWYGSYCEQCGNGLSDIKDASQNNSAESILDAVIQDSVWWDAWRGATNLTKQDQIAVWTKNNLPSSGHGEGSGVDAWEPATRRTGTILSS